MPTSELIFYKYDSGIDVKETGKESEQIGGNGNDNGNTDQTGGKHIIRQYRKRCLEHKNTITQLEKENKELKKKIKELS